MATLTGLIPVTVGTFETYHGGGGGGGYHWGGGGGAGNAERRTIYVPQTCTAVTSTKIPSKYSVVGYVDL